MRPTPQSRAAIWIAWLLIGGLSGLPPAVAEVDCADVERLVTALEGGWTGADNDTPFGKMPFAALFEWQEDGSLYSSSPLNSETYIDLRFARDEAGRWLLHEEAAMEGLGVQSHSLAPAGVAATAGLCRWVYEPDPDYLAIDLGVVEETLRLDVTLRGRPHVAFRLGRVPRELWPEMKRELAAQAALSPEEGTSILEIVSNPPAALTPEPAVQDAAAEEPIAAARERVTAEPDSAAARLELAKRLGAAINEQPQINGPRYAFEMHAALTKAIELDPRLAEAYHWLVGYYLNAPPIAGGSLAKAEETARRLAEFDPEGAAPLLEQIAARTAGAAGSS